MLIILFGVHYGRRIFQQYIYDDGSDNDDDGSTDGDDGSGDDDDDGGVDDDD